MKASELRIGNWIEVFNGNFQVIEITKKDIRIDFFPMPDTELQENSALFNEVTGIPLTEDWLVKLGFQKSDGKYHLSEDFYFSGGNLWIGAPDGQFWRHVMPQGKHEYVHQVQNLYFALTGEELTTKK